MKRVFLVEDEPGLVLTLTDRLTSEGYQVEHAADGARALERASSETFDVILLDVMLPGANGFDIVRDLRNRGVTTPIIMLTARGQVADKVVGLKLGADDYLAKPFEPRELLLRITSILKRGGQPAGPVMEIIRFGPFAFHPERGELKRESQVVRITDRERDILRMFAARPGDTIRRHEFLKVSNGGGERAVDVQMNRLRRKIEVDPSNPVYLQTTRGIGYRLLVD